ncbi:MAG TPA: prepilin-type N-terminal cleavage/methylation domain-containing protein [Verrucomicrobiae bacterium]|jgi:general secretion pathway protein J|nr:prepilin-type N-terminal cleavage/methylation domain-containing protein [Verrucomicrobiae bacterium]
MKNQKGFTLIEVLIAMVIVAVILAGLVASFQTGLAAFKRSEDYLAAGREREVFYLQLEQELRNAVPVSLYPFLGRPDRISFPARLRRYTPKGPEEGLYLIEYQFRNGQLMRRETPLKKEGLRETEAAAETLFEGLREGRFSFLTLAESGPARWNGAWGGDIYPGLPRGVQVELSGGSFGGRGGHKTLLPQGVLGIQT